MNRKQFIQELIRNGCYLKRSGGKHDLYTNARTGKSAPVPRHKKIKDSLCQMIRRQLDIGDN